MQLIFPIDPKLIVWYKDHENDYCLLFETQIFECVLANKEVYQNKFRYKCVTATPLKFLIWVEPVSLCIKQFMVTNCSKERPGSIVTKTLKNIILIPIVTLKKIVF